MTYSIRRHILSEEINNGISNNNATLKSRNIISYFYTNIVEFISDETGYIYIYVRNG